MSSLVFAAVIAGCCGPSPRTPAAAPLQTNRVSPEQAVRIAEDVLGRMSFVIDKADPNAGLVTTRPLPAAQFFELWRSDNVRCVDFAEANLHSIQRTVIVRIGQEQEEVTIQCNVKVQRLSVAEPAPLGTIQMHRMRVPTALAISAGRGRGEQGSPAAWVDLGDDPALAARILKRIEQRLHRQSLIDSR